MSNIEFMAQQFLKDWSELDEESKRVARELDWLCRGTREEAEEAWLVIVEINKHELTDKQRALLAAGPVEILLSKHGDMFIERVEELAAKDANFNLLIGGVWKLSMSDEVWQRVQNARNRIW